MQMLSLPDNKYACTSPRLLNSTDLFIGDVANHAVIHVKRQQFYDT